jgi:hypothetical protein
MLMGREQFSFVWNCLQGRCLGLRVSDKGFDYELYGGKNVKCWQKGTFAALKTSCSFPKKCYHDIETFLLCEGGFAWPGKPLSTLSGLHTISHNFTQLHPVSFLH